MKYRKKPVVIDAEKFDPPVIGNLTHYLNKVGVTMVKDQTGAYTYYYIHTLEGDMFLKRGDWIITGVHGEKYPCKPNIFEMTYEPVDTLDTTSKGDL